MAYQTERNKAGRQPITFLELDADYCPLSYGQAPCTAAVGTTGKDKCYNTRATCQDPEAYVANYGSKTYTFCDSSTGVPADLGAFPTLLDIDQAPTRITPSKGLGERAVVKVTLQDHPHHDIGVDKYALERAYDPMAQGTFWGKWKARNPHYRTRTMRVKTGYLTSAGVDWSNFRTTTYVIDSIKGPDSRGKITVVGKDPLTLLEGKRAVVPAPSRGVLAADIDENATAFNLSPPGIGDAEYPASFRCRIGREGFDVTREGDLCTITARGHYKSASSHSAEDTVQIVKQYEGLQVHEIVTDLIQEGRQDLAQYIPVDKWVQEGFDYLSRRYSGEITKPTAVNELIAELMESCPFYVFWDERRQEITLMAIRPPAKGETLLTDQSEILDGTISVQEVPKDRIDEVWVYFAQIDPTESRNKAENYAMRHVLVDLEAQAPDQYGGRQIKKVYSRWITANNGAAARELGEQYLRRFGSTPVQVKLSLDARHSDLWTGDIAKLFTSYLQGPAGTPSPRFCQVLEAAEAVPGTRFEYELQTYDFTTQLGDEIREVDITKGPTNLREAYEATNSKLTPTVKFIIPHGVVIGSDRTGVPAIETGDWPEGTTVILENRGRIQGRGGSGGAGGGVLDGEIRQSKMVPGQPGTNGGDALHVSYDISIDNSQGEIFAGGGGGGGGGSAFATDWDGWLLDHSLVGGSGGGGGAGTFAGTGAAGGFYKFPDGWLRPGATGSNGTSDTGGTGGLAVTLRRGNATAIGGAGGAGGGPAESGAAGQSGQAWGDEDRYASAGGPGGAAGSAIVQYDGATATITAGNDTTRIKGNVRVASEQWFQQIFEAVIEFFN